MRNAEFALNVQHFLYERLQITKIQDKRRSPSITKLVPYLGGIFSHVLRVPIGPTVTVMKDGKKKKAGLWITNEIEAKDQKPDKLGNS